MSSTTPIAQKALFDQYLKLRRQLVESSLNSYLKDCDPELLARSMSYSVLSGGKRLRALLCLAVAETVEQSQFNIENPSREWIEGETGWIKRIDEQNKPIR